MSNMLYFARRKKNIKQYTMAKDLGVSPSYLSKVETCSQEPTDKFRKSCSEYLGIPSKQLFDEVNGAFISKVEKGLTNKIWTLRRQKNIKQYDLAKTLKVSPSYLSKVETGNQEPSPKFIQDCAKYFKIKENELFPEIKIKQRKSK